MSLWRQLQLVHIWCNGKGATWDACIPCQCSCSTPVPAFCQGACKEAAGDGWRSWVPGFWPQPHLALLLCVFKEWTSRCLYLCLSLFLFCFFLYVFLSAFQINRIFFLKKTNSRTLQASKKKSWAMILWLCSFSSKQVNETKILLQVILENSNCWMFWWDTYNNFVLCLLRIVLTFLYGAFTVATFRENVWG